VSYVEFAFPNCVSLIRRVENSQIGLNAERKPAATELRNVSQNTG
jgi:hypothetical protein